jgi:two-component system, chemotaxis family, sensor kinase CheA
MLRRRRFVSLGTKLTLSVVLALAVATFVIAQRLGNVARAREIEAKAIAASMLCNLVVESLAPAVDFGDQDALTTELVRLKKNPEILYAGVWGRENELPLAEQGIRTFGGVRPPPGSALSIGAERISVVRELSDPQGASLGIVLTEFSLKAEIARGEETRRQILTYATLLGLGLSLMVFGITRLQVIRPLHRLVSATRVLEGGTRAHVQVESNDEIGALGGAFNAMSAAIADRETRLADANRELTQLLDNMRQAIVVFDAAGKLVGFRSRQADAVFGARELEARSVVPLLYPDAPDGVEAAAFRAWLELAFSLSPLDFQQALDLAPPQAVLSDGTRQSVLSLDFLPLAKADKVEQIMLLATDISEQLELERRVRLQDAEHAHQLLAMRRLLAGGGQLLVSLLDGARSRVEHIARILSAPGELDIPAIDDIFRKVHTIKGEARAFDLTELGRSSAVLEDYLELLRSRARNLSRLPSPEDRQELADKLAEVVRATDAAATLIVEASPIGPAILEQVTVRRSDLDRVVEIAELQGGAIYGAVRRLAARPFGESLLYLTEAVPSWGERYGKLVVLDVEGRDVAIPLELTRVLPAALTHLARNAVAHGIETPQERQLTEKPARAVIQIEAREAHDSVEIMFRDDGRGLDRARIRLAAGALGAFGSDEELIFVPGLSTSAQTSLAGRGVGLDAVRQDLKNVGYDIGVASGPQGTTFRIFSAAAPISSRLQAQEGTA